MSTTAIVVNSFMLIGGIVAFILAWDVQRKTEKLREENERRRRENREKRDPGPVQQAAGISGKSVEDFVLDAVREKTLTVLKSASSGYDADDGPLTQEQMDVVREVAKPLLATGPTIRPTSLP